MNFRTRLDITNRQVKQYEKTSIALSGTSTFGVPYSALTSGVDLSVTGITFQDVMLESTYSGNTGTTVYTFGDPRMSIDEGDLSTLTPTNSGTTQFAGPTWVGYNPFVTGDGNSGFTNYSAVTYDIDVSTMIDLGGGAYSGVVYSEFIVYSGNSHDFTGRTIWVDVSGITRTTELIVADNPVAGYVLTCDNAEGKAQWQPASGSTSVWESGVGYEAVKMVNNGGTATGEYSVSEGQGTEATSFGAHSEGVNTLASGLASHAQGKQTSATTFYAHSEGYLTLASAQSSHAQGEQTSATTVYAHAEGQRTLASGYASHAQGSETVASGSRSHAGGHITTASGNMSSAGGSGTTAHGDYSFVFGVGNIVSGNRSVVLGGEGINGVVDDMVYVPDLVIDGLTSTDPIATDANGKIVAGASDARLKTNVNVLESALDKIKNLRGVSYEWTEESGMGAGVKKYGLIAQEVQKVIPDMVRERSKGDGVLSLSYTEVVPWLIEAIKELSSGSTVISNEQVVLETQTITSEDNNIDLNYGGNHETSVGGGITVLDGIKKGVNSEIKIDEDGSWIMNPPLTTKEHTPTSTNDEYGRVGDTVWDDNHIYIKTNAGWKRSSLENF